MGDHVALADLRAGETGKVAEILGERGVYKRLQALGIRKGATIRKVSAIAGRGPVVVQIGGTQAALGFGMSYKVIVEVDR